MLFPAVHSTSAPFWSPKLAAHPGRMDQLGNYFHLGAADTNLFTTNVYRMVGQYGSIFHSFPRGLCIILAGEMWRDEKSEFPSQ